MTSSAPPVPIATFQAAATPSIGMNAASFEVPKRVWESCYDRRRLVLEEALVLDINFILTLITLLNGKSGIGVYFIRLAFNNVCTGPTLQNTTRITSESRSTSPFHYLFIHFKMPLRRVYECCTAFASNSMYFLHGG